MYPPCLRLDILAYSPRRSGNLQFALERPYREARSLTRGDDLSSLLLWSEIAKENHTPHAVRDVALY